MRYSQQEPTVSIVMPSYNGADTLPFAIESVLNQTFTDFQFILFDDASADETRAVMRLYEKLDSRILVLNGDINSRQDSYAREPRNVPLYYARGSLIAYIDDDNLWRNDFLSTMVPAFGDLKIQLAHCNSRNHYASAQQFEAVTGHDQRNLVECDAGLLTTVFSCTDTKAGEPGIDWYIDTNEMMHRCSVFRSIRGAWRTAHPRRAEISERQKVGNRSRRHNDLELVERIIGQFGHDSVARIPEALVEFFYSQNQAAFINLKPAEEIASLSGSLPRREFRHAPTGPALAC